VDNQAKAALRAQHGALAEFTVGGVFLAFKAPTQEQWDEHKKKLRSPKHGKSPAIREICQQCLVHPDLDGFAAVIAKKPAAPAVFADKLGELAGDTLTPVEHSDDTATLVVNGSTWTFGPPPFDVWEDFQEQLATSKAEQEPLFRELAIRSALDSKGLESLFARYPAAHEGIGNVLSKLAGAGIQGEVKKG
jgi:hypothetical protein